MQTGRILAGVAALVLALSGCATGTDADAPQVAGPLSEEGRAAEADGQDPEGVAAIDRQAELIRLAGELSGIIREYPGIGSIATDVDARVITVHARVDEWTDEDRSRVEDLQERAISAGITLEVVDIVLGESELMDLAVQTWARALDHDIEISSAGASPETQSVWFTGPDLAEGGPEHTVLQGLVDERTGGTISVGIRPHETEIEVAF